MATREWYKIRSTITPLVSIKILLVEHMPRLQKRYLCFRILSCHHPGRHGFRGYGSRTADSEYPKRGDPVYVGQPIQRLQMMKLPEGFHATLFAAEPDVHQPIAVTTDHRGRLWVVECYTYSDRKTNYDMSLDDRVVIFEDRDNDGRFDQEDDILGSRQEVNRDRGGLRWSVVDRSSRISCSSRMLIVMTSRTDPPRGSVERI